MTDRAVPLGDVPWKWDLDRIYRILSDAKQRPLTPTEKEYIQGLLAYKRPREIAKERNVEVGGVRVELSKLYELARVSLRQEKVTCTNFAALFRAAGYVLQSDLATVVEPLPDHKPMFLSYCKQDISPAVVEEITAFLDAHGYPVFTDVDPTRLDPSYMQVIADDLRRSDYLILFLSQSIVISEQVLALIQYVQDLWNNRGKKIPAILAVHVDWFDRHLMIYELQQFLQNVVQLNWQDKGLDEAFCQCLLTWIQTQILPEPEQTRQSPTGDRPSTIESSQPYPPLPKASPAVFNEIPTGQMGIQSVLYVERPPIEAECYRTIVQPGALIRIKAPRQMGKTSLMTRILHHAANHDHHTVVLSLQLADRSCFTSLDRFLRWICSYVSQSLNLPNRIKEDWDAELYGSSVSCRNYFKRYILQPLEQPFVLALDELDRVFEYNHLAEDFLSMLRAWYEEGRRDARWATLKLVIVHATDVYVPLNVYQSPFNVGLPIDLPEFTETQMQDLAERYQLRLTASDIQRLRHLVGGHPYLTQVAFYALAYREISLDYLETTAVTESGIYGDHLRRYLWRLTDQPELVEGIQRILVTDQPVRLESAIGYKLQALGLVHLVGNEAAWRCDLYRQYFYERFGNR